MSAVFPTAPVKPARHREEPKGCDKPEKRERHHHDHCKPRKPKHCKHHHRPKHKGCR